MAGPALGPTALQAQRGHGLRALAWEAPSTQRLVLRARAAALVAEALAWVACRLAKRAPLALRTLKMVLNRGADAPLETALELERKAYAWLRSTHDYQEGVRAFLDKRAPQYEGR